MGAGKVDVGQIGPPIRVDIPVLLVKHTVSINTYFQACGQVLLLTDRITRVPTGRGSNNHCIWLFKSWMRKIDFLESKFQAANFSSVIWRLWVLVWPANQDLPHNRPTPIPTEQTGWRYGEFLSVIQNPIYVLDSKCNIIINMASTKFCIPKIYSLKIGHMYWTLTQSARLYL